MNKQILAALLSAFVALSTVQLASESQVSEIANEWATWKQTHSKSYSEQEEAYRFAVFTDNYARLQQLNEELEDSTVGINKFSDLTKQEFKSIYLGYKKNQNAAQLEAFETENLEAAQSVNWVTSGAVTPIKDQGQCGSCWAFGTVGGIEGGYKVSGQSLTSFSEQQIVSCDKVDAGCNGGDLPTAYKYVNGAGLALESEYPYVSGGGSTKSCKSSKHPVSLKKGAVSGKAVKVNHKTSFITALTQQPLSICIEADSDVFNSYTSGVLTSNKCGTVLDHCVTAVGFDLTASTPYVLVKNSWGTSWGAAGYIKIGADSGNKKGTCGIYNEPYLAKF